MFNCSVMVELGNGASARFWTDSWLPARPILTFAPHLFRAIGRRFLLVSVKEALPSHRWVRHISGAHTAARCCTSTSISGRSWRAFSCSRLCVTASFGDGRWMAHTPRPRCTAHSSSACPPCWEPKSFGKLLHCRRKRHGLQDSADCALCGQEDETVDHLLVSCVFARELWHRLLQSFGWDRFTPALGARLSAWWMDVRRQVPKELRKGFDSAVLLASWRLWKECNSRVFDNAVCSPAQAVRRVFEEAEEWIVGAILGSFAVAGSRTGAIRFLAY